MTQIFGLILFNLKLFFNFRFVALWSIVSSLVLFVIKSSLWSYIPINNNQINYDYYQYFLLVIFISSFTTMETDRRLQNEYLSGKIAISNIRPLPFKILYLYKDIASSFSSLIIKGLPLIVFLILFYNIQVVPSLINLVFFIFSLILTFGISWSISYLIGLAVIFFKNNEGFIQAKRLIISLLSGAVIPFNVIPEPFINIFNILPFRALIDVPINIMYCNDIHKIYQYLIFQGIWLIIFYAFTIYLNKIALNKVEIAGG